MDPISRVVAAGAAGAGAAGAALYVDDVFSTHLYEGNSSTRTITNGIDLSGEGGLTWIKCRTISDLHYWYDTERGATKSLHSNGNYAEQTRTNTLTSFNSNGFSLGTDGDTNFSSRDYVSWTFRKAPGFFDVVTYSGNGNSSQTISHSLGCVPGMMIIKRTNQTDTWYVYHRSLGATKFLRLNSNTNSSGATTGVFNNTAPTSTHFTVGSAFYTNSSSGTYVAYLFAHDCADFGANNNEDVIQCGSYTGNGSYSGPTVDLGFEPQFLMVKNTSSSNTNWHIFDTMRGLPVGTTGKYLEADTENSEGSQQVYEPNATGFQVTATGVDWNLSGDVYAYVAIRRPHKPPELATDVFNVNVETEARTASGWTSLSGFVTDAFMNSRNLSSEKYTRLSARLTGGRFMSPDSTSAEGTTVYFGYDTSDGIKEGASTLVSSSDKHIDYHFRRAPGFFDVVTYAGNDTARTISHNLNAAPEMMILKNRSSTSSYWPVYHSALGETHGAGLNTTEQPFDIASWWNDTAPTSSVFSVGTSGSTNNNSDNFIAYLFATLAGISKVGSYTGTGNNVDVNCGFTAGARFVLIRRTDSTGDWYVWDSTRGIVSGNDPYIELNTSDAEVTDTDYLDPLSAGFRVTSSAPAALNASGGTYLFLAIA